MSTLKGKVADEMRELNQRWYDATGASCPSQAAADIKELRRIARMYEEEVRKANFTIDEHPFKPVHQPELLTLEGLEPATEKLSYHVEFPEEPMKPVYVTQEDNYASIRFERDTYSVLLRVGTIRPEVLGQKWYTEVCLTSKIICQEFFSRDEAAKHAVYLYNHYVRKNNASI